MSGVLGNANLTDPRDAMRAGERAEAMYTRVGAPYVVTEAGAETPDSPNPSLHNMRRMGLSEVYARRNWVWFAPQD